MVSYSDVKASNTKVFSDLPTGLVAVFVGATNGIGEYTLKQFARYARSPRVYFLGRSQEAGSRIAAECQTLNESGTFTFIQADTSLIHNVDGYCIDIKKKEPQINLLVLSTGTLDFYTTTSEGLRLAAALVHFSRARFIYNFLPELRAATSLRRVVSVFAGTKEDQLFHDDINAEHVSMMKARGHAASLVTTGMMSLAQQAPNVSFVHTFPGPVKSGIGREIPGVLGILIRTFATIFGPFFYIPNEESGAYHLYFATAPRYSARDTVDATESDATALAKGIDGNTGSGMYCIDERGESAGPTVVNLLATLKQNGTVDKVWQDTLNEWDRILHSNVK